MSAYSASLAFNGFVLPRHGKVLKFSEVSQRAPRRFNHSIDGITAPIHISLSSIQFNVSIASQ